MKKIIVLVAIMFFPLVANAGWKFNDFNMAKMDQYNHAEWFSVTGENVLGVNFSINPMAAYESESLPTVAFGAPGAGMVFNQDTQDGAITFDFIHFGPTHFGAYKPADQLGEGRFFDGWNLKMGAQFKF